MARPLKHGDSPIGLRGARGEPVQAKSRPPSRPRFDGLGGVPRTPHRAGSPPATAVVPTRLRTCSERSCGTVLHYPALE